ncbi:MAG: hypothetical protein H6742_14840 [Alphaproteobacteria bacterium]|nr:hypothetical protein [Alphaproteobacteria bacterium]
MKITCEWMVLAERVIEDSATGNLTIVSCLEQVRSLGFPAQHHGFAMAARFRCVDAPPERDGKLRMRLVRASDHDPDEVVAEVDSVWQAGERTARWVMRFRYLRLRRPETLRFRLDHKVGRAAWQEGPTATLDILELDLSDDERQALERELQALERAGYESPT